jgi:hypothetical protein
VADQMKELQEALVPVVTVAPVRPELALKKTSSPVPGTEAPPAPPSLADQFVVEVASHVPEPPTQYLFADFPLKHINVMNTNSSLIVFCIIYLHQLYAPIVILCLYLLECKYFTNV